MKTIVEFRFIHQFQKPWKITHKDCTRTCSPSTVTAKDIRLLTRLLNLYQKIYMGLKKTNYTLGVFLDLSKAFDTINHGILLHKLEHYAWEGWPWIRSGTTCQNANSYSCVGALSTATSRLVCGVSQASILGPLLF